MDCCACMQTVKLIITKYFYRFVIYISHLEKPRSENNALHFAVRRTMHENSIQYQHEYSRSKNIPSALIHRWDFFDRIIPSELDVGTKLFFNRTDSRVFNNENRKKKTISTADFRRAKPAKLPIRRLIRD